MGDDALARAVALVMVGLFIAAQIVSYIDRKHPVPAEIYPLTTMAVGYLLGHKFLRDKDEKEKDDR